MSEHGWKAAGAAELQSDASMNRSIIGVLRTRDLRLTGSGAGLAAVGGDLTIENGGCGPVVANGGVTITNGGCGPLVANGDVSIENGGCGQVVAARGVTLGRNAIAGIVISPSVTVADGARVLISSPLALAIGAAAGAAFALLARAAKR